MIEDESHKRIMKSSYLLGCCPVASFACNTFNRIIGDLNAGSTRNTRGNEAATQFCRLAGFEIEIFSELFNRNYQRQTVRHIFICCDAKNLSSSSLRPCRSVPNLEGLRGIHWKSSMNIVD